MRIFHRIYAWMFGYFWLECPVCRNYFGGHEISNRFTAALIRDDGRAYSVCHDPQCSHEAGVLNVINGRIVSMRRDAIKNLRD